MNAKADFVREWHIVLGLYVQWIKLKAVMLKFKSGCSLDTNILLTVAIYLSNLSHKLGIWSTL